MKTSPNMFLLVLALAVSGWAIQAQQGGAPSPSPDRPIPGQPPSRRGSPPFGPSRGGRNASAPGQSSSPSAAPVGKSEVEKRVLAVLDDMEKNQREGHAPNVQREEGRLLRVLAESTGAKHVVEIGTANGYSTIWLCLGLQSTGGKLTTYEIDPQLAARARANFDQAGVDKIATVVVGDAHVEAPKLKEPIDILFLDADKEGYVDYLEKLSPLIRPGGLVIAHDMNQGMADPRYLKAINSSPDLESVFLNTFWGLGVTLKKH
jgi:caffeoyl-CoA O-methyltransferase